jgi:hypothetical protein
VIAHIVFFNPKADVTAAEKRSFAQALTAVGRDVAAIERAYVGRAVAVDAGYERSFGETTYHYAAVLEFRDRDGLVAYLTHASHEVLGRLFWEFCEATAIVEVETSPLRDDLGDFLV